MNPVAHLVGCERPTDFLNYNFVRRNFGESQSCRGPTQPGEMFIQLKDPPLVEPQTLPDRIAPLHRRIEWTYAGFVAMHKPAIDVHKQVAVFFVKSLKHDFSGFNLPLAD
jgi:hypothetical protein